MFPLRTLSLAALGIALVAALPSAGAETQTGTTSTGDVDVYNLNVGPQVCLQVITFWEFRLTLINPNPTDAVAISTQGNTPDAALATALDPVTSVHTSTQTSCGPLVEVVGVLVVGELTYQLETIRTFTAPPLPDLVHA